MFENLSNREKKLLLGIGALLPIVIIFFGFTRLIKAYNDNKDERDRVELQILEQKDIELEGMKADRRQTYYANASLDPRTNVAGNRYQRWLKARMSESGLTDSGISISDGSRFRSNSESIGRSSLLKTTVVGTLPQLNDFLSKFYQLDMLHRIKEMTLTPQNEPRSSKPVRDGTLAVKLTFEVLSLEAGKSRDNFDDFSIHLVNSEKNYDDILKRNIFGPANSEPVLKVSNKTGYLGKSISTSISATDANKSDLLKFELIESDVPEAFLKPPTRETDKSVRFEMPKMPLGSYKFTVKVSDSGFPVKSSTKEFTVTVKPVPKKPEPKVAKKPKPEPEVDYIRLVKVTGITSDRDGKRRVWVSVGPTGERLRLSVGETFEIGKKEYEVLSVDQDKATFAGDDKTFVARPDFESRGKFKETSL